ncbi:16S rRNA (guanine(527)-N(7))-methyltransferase RsmG [Helicobacter mesocricetorum]|uniref:16S rRNA (guanine(527)-N(7))-methyltransferase RsmG n=1 Tax=Helicobacter mesocricetorum TaxID=87012 RepID=UPI000CF0C800|nr:16S rRNA (guanine(527)-N(7))-methyltransferase RsmG [Helicobacter mesocricetorum]
MSLELSLEMLQKLESYREFLHKWNKIHNLSGAKDSKEILKNIEDSLYPLSLQALNLQEKKILFDVGSGNGFPAVPLGIALQIPVVLCEPNAKKAAFLQNLKAQLALENFEVLRQRVESVKYHKKIDFITSRATFELPSFLKKVRHLMHKETLVLLYKGSSVQSEMIASLEVQQYKRGLRHYLVFKGEALCNG